MQIGKLHIFAINENRKPAGRKGSILRSGRLFIGWGDTWELAWEWDLWSRSCGVGVEVGMGDSYEAQFHAAVPPVSTFFTVSSWRYLRWLPDARRCLGVKVHHGATWFDIWSKWGEWNSSDPWWMSFHIDPVDLLLGRSEYSERDLEEGETKVAMPEKVYDATYRTYESTWKRPRWPWPSRLVRTTIDVPEGIPVPGKGENSWDCGEDAIYGETSPSPTVEDAVGTLVKSALRTRRRYGGRDWTPEAFREVPTGR